MNTFESPHSEKTLYQLVSSGLAKKELSSEIIIKFLKNNGDISKETKQRLLNWFEELKFWEGYAAIYKNLEKARPYSSLSKTIEGLIEPKPGDIWLDVGCGPAKMSQLVWKKSKKSISKVVGIDIVLSPAQKTLEQTNHEMPLELIYANLGEVLPLPDNYFDGIIANLVIPYVTDFNGKTGIEAFTAVLKEMYRVLKPGGQIIWSTPKKNVHFQWVFVASIPDMLNPIPYILKRDITRILQGVGILKHALEIQKKGKKSLYNFLPIKQIEKILEQIGFSNLLWKRTFSRQVLVNKAYKPIIPLLNP